MPRKRIVVHNYLPVPARDQRDAVKYEIEFSRGKRFPLAAYTDAAIDAAVKKAGLWKPGKEYPHFTIYSDGEEDGGGGGPNSGAMDARDADLQKVEAAIRDFRHIQNMTKSGAIGVARNLGVAGVDISWEPGEIAHAVVKKGYGEAIYKEARKRLFATNDAEVELVQYNSGKWGWKMPNGKIAGPYPATPAGKAAAEAAAEAAAKRHEPDPRERAKYGLDARDAEGPYYSAVMKGWMFYTGGQNYGPYPTEAKAKTEWQSKASPLGDRRARDAAKFNPGDKVKMIGAGGDWKDATGVVQKLEREANSSKMNSYIVKLDRSGSKIKFYEGEMVRSAVERASDCWLD